MRVYNYLTSLLVIGAVLLAVGNLYSQEAPIKELYVELVLDASNSMNELLGSTRKIDVAKQAINDVLSTLSPETNLALRVYGSDRDRLTMKPGQSQADVKREACLDSALKVPFGKDNVEQVREIVIATRAAGYTPIAYSLEKAGNDFPDKDATNYIILLSDGIETCGGNPVEAAERLRKSGFEVVTHAMGFAVDAEARKQLQSIASAGDGKYYTADTADQLKDSLKEIIDAIGAPSALFEEGEEKTIVPGTNFENATLIPEPGKYALKNLATGEELQHTVKLKCRRDELLKINATVFLPWETDEQYFLNFHIDAYDKNKKKVGRSSIYKTGAREPGNANFQLMTEQEEEEFYLSFFSKAKPLDRMTVYLDYTVEKRSDANSDSDVEDKFSKAYKIEPGKYESNWIFPINDKDMYVLPVEKGSKLSVKILPDEDNPILLTLKLWNEDREEIARVRGSNKFAVIKEEYIAQEPGDVYINVLPVLSTKVGRYSMKIGVTPQEKEQGQ